MTHAGRRCLRVCLDARIPDGVQGGVQQTVIGLAEGLAALGGRDEEYAFLTIAGADEWLRPHVRDGCRMLPAVAPPPPPRPAPWRRLARRLLGAQGTRLVEGYVIPALVRGGPSASDGTIEAAGVDVMHFTTQDGFRTRVPSIYVPHDLQHLHHPEFFTFAQRRRRRAFYPALAIQARHVVSLSRYGKADLVSKLGVPAGKVSVIGWAPPLDAYGDVTEDDVDRARDRFSLPRAFALYPAQTWRHKNHLSLLEAVARLRDRDALDVHVVCTGHANEFGAIVARRVRALRLERLVSFLGFVTPAEMRALYRLARMLVFPSRFEGFGMPVVEAFRAGVPVACSNVTALPEVAGDAALLFDPGRVDELAAAVRRVWTDAGLRDELVAKGKRRVAALTWREVARRYRALYRATAARELDCEDRALLAQMQ